MQISGEKLFLCSANSARMNIRRQPSTFVLNGEFMRKTVSPCDSLFLLAVRKENFDSDQTMG